MVGEGGEAAAVEVAAFVHEVGSVRGPVAVEVVLGRDPARTRVERAHLRVGKAMASLACTWWFKNSFSESGNA